MTEIEVGGATLDEAIAQGLSELGASRDEVEVEVLSESAPVLVKLTLRAQTSTREDAPNGEESPDSAEPADSAPERARSDASREGTSSDPQEILEFGREDALDFLEGVLDAMDLEGEVRVEVSEEESLQATVDGPHLGVLIGRHGRTLDAIQELLRAAVQHQGGARIRITLDIEGYRERRREAVAEMARDIAEQALEEGEARMEPMAAYERKVVHDTVAEIEGVTSESEGEEPDRYVVVRRGDTP
jgi:spoIIIJ-associated protein